MSTKKQAPKKREKVSKDKMKKLSGGYLSVPYSGGGVK